MPLQQAALAQTLPAASVTRIYRSGQTIPGVGLITSPFFPGLNSGEGFLGVSVNNAGTAVVQAGVYANPGFNRAILLSSSGLSPVLAAGVESPAAGSVAVPSGGYVFQKASWVSINNAGTLGLSLSLVPGPFASVPPVTGAYFGVSALPFAEGSPVTALGVLAGTTFAALDSDGFVRLNDQNVYLFGGRIIEGGQSKRALIKIAVNGAGQQISQTLVAKEGGPVPGVFVPGGAPDTWTSVSTTPSSAAINGLGQVVFSGVTAGGINGVFRTSSTGGGFVVRQGDATPVGNVWGPLFGVPVDLNIRGQFAFRGIVGQGGAWTELGDAGETITNSFSFTANATLVGGALEQIVGELSNDHDVDAYFITVGDPTLTTQTAFSATTVPDPGTGFTGAGFDSVLYLFRDNFNANGNYRQCVGRSDNAAPGVTQSTLTTASLPTTHTPGTRYFLVIGTPKTRATGGSTTPGLEQWQPDPGRLAALGNTVYWVDPSRGEIGRADVGSGGGSGTLLTPLSVSEIPRQTTEGQSTSGDAPVLSDLIAVWDDGSLGKVYFYSRAFGQFRIRRANLDGTGIEDVIASGTPNAVNTSALAIDQINAKLYWSALSGGTAKIFRADVDGANRETVLDFGSVVTISDVAVDSVGGRVYWANASDQSIGSSLINGTDVRTLLTGATASRLAIDQAGRRLYYTSTVQSRVGAINLVTGAALADVAQTPTPWGVVVDAARSSVLWASPLERLVRRAPLGGGTEQAAFSIGSDVGEVPGDGPGYLNSTTAFARYGSAGTTPLGYRIRLTGATAANPLALISRDNRTTVALAGQVLPDTGASPVTTVGAANSPVRINDRGAVYWRGRWTQSGTRTGVFVDRRVALLDTRVLGSAADVLGSVPSTAEAFDVSDDGRQVVASATNGSFNFSAVNCVLLSFASAPGCNADFDSSGVVSIDDIFIFLNAWFAGSSLADIDASGVVTIDDIFIFLNVWFAGC